LAGPLPLPTNPVAVAGFVIVAAYFAIGTLLIKYGVVKVLIPSIVILGLACIGIAISGTNLLLYSISLFLVRLFVTPLQMSAFMLCTNWFIKYRGRALGLITIGAPLFTATGIAGMAYITNRFGLFATYTGVGVIILALALFTALVIKSRPEECGLYSDGSDCEVETSAGAIKTIPFGELARNSGFWLLIISFGILQFVIVAIMAFYTDRMTAVGTDPVIYFVWLSVAAIMGLPISLLLGYIDDKFGTVIAAITLCVTFLVAIISLLLMTANNIPLIAIAAIGIAGMTGGTPNLHPSITVYVFGRDQYQAANRWIMAIQSIPMALAITFMALIMDQTGSLDLAYEIMLWLVAISVICLIIIGRKPDYDHGRKSVSVGLRPKSRITNE
jgi:MFS family permease